MKKLFVRIIDGCMQCDHMQYNYGESLYVCYHPAGNEMILGRSAGFPEKCPLDDVIEEDIVEPGC